MRVASGPRACRSMRSVFDPYKRQGHSGVYPLTPQAQAELERRYPAQMLAVSNEQVPPRAIRLIGTDSRHTRLLRSW